MTDNVTVAAKNAYSRDLDEDIALLRNMVRVTIWFSKAGSAQLRPMGHAAIETFCGGPNDYGYYISLWPGKCNEFNDGRDELYCHKSESHLHTVDDDALTYGQAVDNELTFDLYSLDVDAINSRIEEFLKVRFSWGYLGGFLFSFVGNEHCSSLVNRLLVSGNIQTLYERVGVLKRTFFPILLQGFLAGIIRVAILYAYHGNIEGLLNGSIPFRPLLLSLRLITELIFSPNNRSFDYIFEDFFDRIGNYKSLETLYYIFSFTAECTFTMLMNKIFFNSLKFKLLGPLITIFIMKHLRLWVMLSHVILGVHIGHLRNDDYDRTAGGYIRDLMIAFFEGQLYGATEKPLLAAASLSMITLMLAGVNKLDNLIVSTSILLLFSNVRADTLLSSLVPQYVLVLLSSAIGDGWFSSSAFLMAPGHVKSMVESAQDRELAESETNLYIGDAAGQSNQRFQLCYNAQAQSKWQLIRAQGYNQNDLVLPDALKSFLEDKVPMSLTQEDKKLIYYHLVDCFDKRKSSNTSSIGNNVGSFFTRVARGFTNNIREYSFYVGAAAVVTLAGYKLTR